MFVVFYSHKMFSLKKLAFYACNKEEQSYYNEDLETIRIDLEKCCKKVFKFWADKGKYTSKLVPHIGKYK